MKNPNVDSKRTKNLVGERVRRARSSHRPPLDQVDLAACLALELGCPVGQTTISRLETGDRPVSDLELVALARILDVSAHWLLYGDEASVSSAAEIPARRDGRHPASRESGDGQRPR